MIIKTLPEEIQNYLADAANYKGWCDKVYIPESIEEIPGILKEAYQNNIKVTVAGNGTGLTGARVPEGGVVISTEKLNRIIEINKEQFYAVVEPGVILTDLLNELRGYDLLYPPDPTEKNCFIGANAATNASGEKTFKYGPTRNFILEMDVVLSNGDTLKLKRDEQKAVGYDLNLISEEGNSYKIKLPGYKMPATKNASGYYCKENMDAIDLFIGSEGTLGVITRLKLKLLPYPEKILSCIVFFNKEDDALNFLTDARSKSFESRKKKDVNSLDALALEFFDENALNFLKDDYGNIPGDAGAAVWFEQEVNSSNEELLFDQWMDLVRQFNGNEESAWFAMDEVENQKIKKFRHFISEKIIDYIARNNVKKLGTDTAVPDASFKEFYYRSKKIAREANLFTLVYGHFGNSHTHLNLLPKNEEEYQRGKLTYNKIVKAAVEYGGTVSAEHGIGKLKAAYLTDMYGEEVIKQMLTIKRAFDPKFILGYGNIIEKKFYNLIDSNLGGTMKTFLSFLFLLLFSSLLSAQWTSVNPYPTPSNLYMGSAPSENRYITVTPNDEVVLTHDGGQTWNVINMNTDGIFRSCFFISDNIGWAVGAYMERMHKTTDGGLTWTHIPNSPDTTKYDVYFVSENVGWSVGFNGFIIKTTDGGNTWFSQSNTAITTKTLFGIAATDLNNVYIAGSTNALLKSTDGGNNWILLPQIFSTNTDYKRVYFPPTGTGLTGFVVGNYSRIAKTSDGGLTWTPVNSTTTSTQLWEIDFNNLGVGLASGAASTLLRTTNGGNTWSPIGGFPASIIFYSVRFGSDNVAYLSGSNGYFYKSTDAGATWFPISYRFTSTTLNDVCFSDSLNGYVVGTNFIARSTNGGTTFTVQTSPYSGELNEISSPSPDIAVAGGDAGNIVYTTNGGVNWILTNGGFSQDILAIDFINNTTGFVAGYNGAVAKSTDGGATWDVIGTISGGSPWDMDMVDSLYGWVSATGERIFGTTDGGFTWTQQLAAGGLGTYGISFLDRARGVAGGISGNTYYTTDGGITWNPAVTAPGYTVRGIHYAESPVGTFAMTACASGYVYLSTDGGANWYLEPRRTINTFNDVWMSDAGHAWFAGNLGTIIKYYKPSNVPVELNSFTASLQDMNVILNWTTSTETNNSGFAIEKADLDNHEKAGGSEYQMIGFVKGNGTTTSINSYSFTDKNLSSGTYSYRLKQIDLDGSYKYYVLPEDIQVGIPYEFSLMQNYPNPFNPATRIEYQLPADGFTTLKIYNILGKEIISLVNEVKSAGRYEVSFDASSLPSGVYYYTLTSGDYTSTKKMMLLK